MNAWQRIVVIAQSAALAVQQRDMLEAEGRAVIASEFVSPNDLRRSCDFRWSHRVLSGLLKKHSGRQARRLVGS
jgi:hypothetical protein